MWSVQPIHHQVWMGGKRHARPLTLINLKPYSLSIRNLFVHFYAMDADVNASLDTPTLGAVVNQPEKSTMYCSLHSLSGLKPNHL